jgi:hypothetical protein
LREKLLKLGLILLNSLDTQHPIEVKFSPLRADPSKFYIPWTPQIDSNYRKVNFFASLLELKYGREPANQMAHASSR